jgi:uncharacterized protein (DUF1330 family)
MKSLEAQVAEYNTYKCRVEIVYQDFGRKILVADGIIKDIFEKDGVPLIVLESGLAIPMPAVKSIKEKK